MDLTLLGSHREGTEVDFNIDGTPCRGIVMSSPYYNSRLGSFVVAVRRLGRNRKGNLYPILRRKTDEIIVAKDIDPAQANKCAEWLRRSGERRAAVKLREAFPLEDGK